MDPKFSPLTSYRRAHGLTLEAFGARLSVDKSTVLRWERGRVPVERLVDVERETGISRNRLRPDLFLDPFRKPADRVSA